MGIEGGSICAPCPASEAPVVMPVGAEMAGNEDRFRCADTGADAWADADVGSDAAALAAATGSDIAETAASVVAALSTEAAGEDAVGETVPAAEPPILPSPRKAGCELP